MAEGEPADMGLAVSLVFIDCRFVKGEVCEAALAMFSSLADDSLPRLSFFWMDLLVIALGSFKSTVTVACSPRTCKKLGSPEVVAWGSLRLALLRGMRCCLEVRVLADCGGARSMLRSVWSGKLKRLYMLLMCKD